jgi:hypothetical protein
VVCVPQRCEHASLDETDADDRGERGDADASVGDDDHAGRDFERAHDQIPRAVALEAAEGLGYPHRQSCSRCALCLQEDAGDPSKGHEADCRPGERDDSRRDAKQPEQNNGPPAFG